MNVKQIMDKSCVYPLLLKGVEIVIVDFNRLMVFNLTASTFPTVQSLLESENVFFFMSV